MDVDQVEAHVRSPKLEPQAQPVKSRPRWLLAWLGGAFLIGALVAWGYWEFGSLRIAVRYLNGERLFVSSDVVSFGEGRIGELRDFSISVTNLGSADAIVIGCSVDCPCLSADHFPLPIGPGETRTLHIKAKLGPQAGDFNHVLTYYTDSDDLPIFHVSVQGQVVE